MMIMNVSGAGKYAALYLYAGPASTSETKASSITPASTGESARDGRDVVEISEQAKAASAKLTDTQLLSMPTLKQKVDALYAEVKSRGSSVTFDISKPGELLNVSSLTDDELGKIVNDKSGEYPQALSDYAGGALNARVKVSLEPYENAVNNGDRRGHAMAIDMLYEQMSPDTRAALGWTSTMMTANDNMRDGDTRIFGKFDPYTVMTNLLTASHNGGLGFDGSQTDSL